MFNDCNFDARISALESLLAPHLQAREAAMQQQQIQPGVCPAYSQQHERLNALPALPLTEIDLIVDAEVKRGTRDYIGKPVRAVRLSRDYNYNDELLAKDDAFVEFKDQAGTPVWAHMPAADFEKNFRELTNENVEYMGVKKSRLVDLLARLTNGMSANQIEALIASGARVAFYNKDEQVTITKHRRRESDT